MSSFQLFTVVGAMGLLICAGSLIALHFLPTGFHPVRDPVSNYAVSRYGFLYPLQAFSSGICGVCLLALISGLGPGWPAWGTIALGGYSLARLAIGFFPTDVQPQRTRTGIVHMVLAAITFAGIACAAGALTSSLTRLAIWSGVGAALQGAAFLTEASAVAFVVVISTRPFRPIAGLIERGIYCGTLAWLGLVFANLLRAL
jgi:hypothetical protein